MVATLEIDLSYVRDLRAPQKSRAAKSPNKTDKHVNKTTNKQIDKYNLKISFKILRETQSRQPFD